MLRVRDRVTLTIEKPAAGGWMIARHEGQVVLVTGAIPGERVVAGIERAERTVAYGVAIDVLEPHADRRRWKGDWTCGGISYAFIAYPRQLGLKAEVIADAFARLAHLPLPSPVTVVPSEERGYRMRARFHVREGRIGFYRESTHDLCDAASTGQLLDDTIRTLDRVGMRLKKLDARPIAVIELAENAAASERVLHLQLRAGRGVRTAAYAPLAGVRGLTGVTSALSTGAPTVRLGGDAHVHDDLTLPLGGTSLQARPGSTSPRARLRRHARSFFQGNRYLLAALVGAVVDAVGVAPDDEILDLYAGVGLLAVALAASGWQRVVAVEGDRWSGEDLRTNAAPFGERIAVQLGSVEESLRRRTGPPAAAIVVDPPRTGLSKDAADLIAAHGARRIIYVSCDIATLARDARKIVDAGYELASVEALDLFPNTPHVETIAVFTRE